MGVRGLSYLKGLCYLRVARRHRLPVHLVVGMAAAAVTSDAAATTSSATGGAMAPGSGSGTFGCSCRCGSLP